MITRIRNFQEGQALIIIALGFTLIIGMVGLAVDAGHDYLVSRQVQIAADAAALGGGKRLISGSAVAPTSSTSPPVQVAHDLAQANGFPTLIGTTCDDHPGAGTQAGATPPAVFNATWYSGYTPQSRADCEKTSGFVNRVSVYYPMLDADVGEAGQDCANGQRFCFEVKIWTRIQNYLFGALGTPFTTVTARAVTYAVPPGVIPNIPPPQAVWVYEPSIGSGGCDDSKQQCYDRTAAPKRTSLSCGTGLCPTFWIPTVQTAIAGIDGSLAELKPNQGDTTGVESNGDMAIQAVAELCDTYDGGLASPSPVKCPSPGVAPFPKAISTTGQKGFSLPSSATLYCHNYHGTVPPSATAGAPPTGLQGCSNTNPPGSEDDIYGNETSFLPPYNWKPNIDTSNVIDCTGTDGKVGLILNGDDVTHSFWDAAGSGAGASPTSAPSNACLPAVDEPYTVKPAKYAFIAVNHGSYVFDGGLFDITSTAPVATDTVSVNNSTVANGIDHTPETNTDFDLCNGAKIQSPPNCNLTAAVWITQGNAGYAPASAGTTSSSGCSGGTAAQSIQGGGGQATDITGDSTTFLLEKSGFVSTSKADVDISAPDLGGNAAVGNLPILFDMTNSGWIHLDANKGSTSQDGFSGIIYQGALSSADASPYDAVGGGVEIDPGLNGGNHTAALSGQVIAYSLTTFGNPGTAVDFSNGLAGPTAASATATGTEAGLVPKGSQPLPVATTINGQNYVAMELDYIDEWSLDAYDAWFQINGVNNGNKFFFSNGIWNPNDSAHASSGTYNGSSPTLPPEDATTVYQLGKNDFFRTSGGTTYGPGWPASGDDRFGLYNRHLTGTSDSQPSDWVYGFTPSGQANPIYFEMGGPILPLAAGNSAQPTGSSTGGAGTNVGGHWAFGHQKDFAPLKTIKGDYTTSMVLFFPTPSASTLSGTMFILDGDHCGDSETLTFSYPNPGSVAGPTTTTGTVLLEE